MMRPPPSIRSLRSRALSCVSTLTPPMTRSPSTKRRGARGATVVIPARTATVSGHGPRLPARGSDDHVGEAAQPARDGQLVLDQSASLPGAPECPTRFTYTEAAALIASAVPSWSPGRGASRTPLRRRSGTGLFPRHPVASLLDAGACWLLAPSTRTIRASASGLSVSAD